MPARTLPRRFTVTESMIGAVGLEHALDAEAVRDLAHGEGGVQAGVLLGDDHAFVGLHALAVAFLDLDVDDDGVAGAEVGQLALRLASASNCCSRIWIEGLFMGHLDDRGVWCTRLESARECTRTRVMASVERGAVQRSRACIAADPLQRRQGLAVPAGGSATPAQRSRNSPSRIRSALSSPASCQQVRAPQPGPAQRLLPAPARDRRHGRRTAAPPARPQLVLGSGRV